MTFSVRGRHLISSGGAAAAGPPGRLTGIALMTGSAASNQVGAATAALAFPVLGPAGVVAVRQWIAGVLLLAAARPKFASLTREQWRPVLALALIFATMNLSLYLAIDTIGLGLAVTLEFLGPLSVALLAARRVIDLGCALIAGAAVVVLARPQPSTDYTGIFLALLAAACWAGYILVNRVVGARVPGSQGPAAAASLSALLYVPVGIWALASHPVTAAALGRAAAAGLLCSAVPMVADMLALRRVPARFFGVFMSVNPVFAALTGLIVLGQSFGLADWLAVAAIVTANAVSVSAGGQARGSGQRLYRTSAAARACPPRHSRRPRLDVTMARGHVKIVQDPRLPAADTGRMAPTPVNLNQALAAFSDIYSPRIVGRVNDYDIRIAHAMGDHVWHVHEHTDEFFLVLDGQFDVTLRENGRERTVSLRAGEIFVVPRGTEHRPSSPGGSILMFEPSGTLTTGDRHEGEIPAHVDSTAGHDIGGNGTVGMWPIP